MCFWYRSIGLNERVSIEMKIHMANLFTCTLCNNSWKIPSIIPTIQIQILSNFPKVWSTKVTVLKYDFGVKIGDFMLCKRPRNLFHWFFWLSVKRLVCRFSLSWFFVTAFHFIDIKLIKQKVWNQYSWANFI